MSAPEKEGGSQLWGERDPHQDNHNADAREHNTGDAAAQLLAKLRRAHAVDLAADYWNDESADVGLRLSALFTLVVAAARERAHGR